MKKVWLLTNSNSGSFDAAMCTQITQAIETHGGVFDRHVALPEHELPSVAEVEAADVDILAIFTGDGTINAATQKLEGWGGDILILPGGTMNLLSKALHGDIDAPTIVERAFSSMAHSAPLPIVSGCGHKALVGIIAGPTAAWVDVREDMRALDIRSLTETIPGAIAETLRGDMVRMEGHEGEYQAIFIQPFGDGLEAMGIKAQSAGELFKHGIAWLTGDFRKGPAEILSVGPTVTVECDGDVGLLVDGEKVEGGHPCTFTREMSKLRFIATLPATA